MKAFSLASTPPHTPPSKTKPSPISGGPASRIPKTPVSQLKSAFRPSLSGCARSPVSPQVMVTDAPTSPSLESLAAWVSTNYMGMGKSAQDALPELRRKGIAISGNSFTMNGKPMAATEIAQALRLQVRPGSRSASPAKPPSASQASSSAPPAAPAAPASAGSTSGLEGLAAWISANYMGMGKSAVDALPELRRKGITASGNSFVMGGQVMSALEIASALRLQARPGSRPNSPVTSSPRPARPSSAGRSAPFFGSQPPADISPPRPAAASPSQGGLSSSMQAQAAGLRWLARWIAANYTGMGRTEMDVLPELRRKNVVCSSVRGGQHFFRVPGHGTLDAARVAQVLNLQARSGTKADSFASPSVSPLRGPATPPNSPQAQLSRSMSYGDSSLDGLAAFIAANYMGLGKSAMDTKPELRRRGVVNAGQDMYSMGGQMMSAPEIASALRLQARTPSRPSTPTPSRAPSSPSSPSSYSAPAAAAPASSSASGMEGLAAWISANYMGMGKSAADAMPELRRKGITAVGSNSYSIAGRTMDAAGIAQALRLQARNPSRPITPPPSSSAASSAAAATFSAPSTPATPAASAGSAPGMDGLAAFIAANYSGMGKSAMDVLPELRRKGITASGSSFSMGGQLMSAPEIASALRLQPRTPSRPSTPIPSRAPAPPSAAPASYSAPAAAPAAPASAGSAPGLEGLAAFIAANYAGMGKSAMDVLPELRRKGITASGNSFVMGGQLMDGAGIAQALRLQARTPSRPSTPIPSRAPITPSAAPASYSAPAAAPAAPASAGSTSGLEGLAAYISANYVGMGKSAMDALPELRRKGITASGNNFVMGGQQMDADGIAQALRLQARTPSRPSTPPRPRSVSPAPSSRSTPASHAAPAAAPTAPASAGSTSGLEGLAAWISANYMGMGKSAADAMPELRRKGITAIGNNSYSMTGRTMDAAGIAQALRLQARKPSSAPAPAPARPSSAPSPAPAAKAAEPKPSRPASSWDWAVKMTPERAMTGTRWLAAWLSANYIGVGKSEADALPELRRKGVVCSAIRGGEHKFEVPGIPRDLSATEVAAHLKLRPRSGALPKPL